MTTQPRHAGLAIFATLYWLLTALLAAAVTVMTLYWTPVEQSMGPVQKIFYLHLPSAINTLLAAFIVFVASIGYLLQRKSAWDDLAAAAARSAAVFGAIVLITGMIWGKAAWGQWWTWSPRLTFSLVLWLLYVVYLIIRPSVEGEHRRALVCAVYGIVAFLDVPLVWLSARLMPDIHPGSIQLEPEMKLTLLAAFVPVTMAALGLTVTGWRLAASRRRKLADHAELEAQTA